MMLFVAQILIGLGAALLCLLIIFALVWKTSLAGWLAVILAFFVLLMFVFAALLVVPEPLNDGLIGVICIPFEAAAFSNEQIREYLSRRRGKLSSN